MKKSYWWVVGMILLTLSFLLDGPVIRLIESIRNPGLNSAMIGFTYIGSKYVCLLLLTFFLFYDKKKRKFIVPWWITFVVSLGVVYALKSLIGRERPTTIISLVEETNFAFPSGHATMAFSSLPIIYRSFKENKKFWLVYVVLIAISRIYLGVHYLSDVIAGMLLGLLMGVIFLHFSRK